MELSGRVVEVPGLGSSVGVLLSNTGRADTFGSQGSYSTSRPVAQAFTAGPGGSQWWLSGVGVRLRSYSGRLKVDIRADDGGSPGEVVATAARQGSTAPQVAADTLPFSDWDYDILAGRFTEVAASESHACALAADRTIACWGEYGRRPDRAAARRVHRAGLR